MTRRRTALAGTAAGALLVSLAAVGAAPPAAGATTGPTLTIDARVLGAAIPATVYGASFPTADFASAARIGWARWGGNRSTRYDYLNVRSNTGSDYYFENVAEDTSMQSFITANEATGARVSVTVPMAGWVAKDTSSCGFPQGSYATQDAFEFWRPTCGNGESGGSPIAVTQPPTLTSTAFTTTNMTEMATAMDDVAGTPLLYHLDNEPSLWTSTHRDIVPTAETSSAFFARSSAAAAAIKAGDPAGRVMGPGEWGYCSWFYFPHDGGCQSGDESTAAGMPYAQAYLAAMRSASDTAGIALLDVFDEHFYPQAPGVFSDAAGDAATQALRLRSVRGLWDPTYTDESWIADLPWKQAQLIPRMRGWIDAAYAGATTKPALGISEYSFGALGTMNGALAQADALGVLGREGVSYAALWAPPSSATSPGTFAFRMFRNLDGKGAAFGTRSVQATSDDLALSDGAQDGSRKVSVFAALRADGALTVVLINKTGTSVTSPLTVKGKAAAPTFTRYVYSTAHPTSIVASTEQTSTLASSITLPAGSITTLVLPKAPAQALSLGRSASAVTYPGAVKLTARLTSGGSAVAGAPVRFDRRTAGTTTWTSIGTVTTDASGYARLSQTPGKHTEYRARDGRTAKITLLPAPATSPVLVRSRRSATLTTSTSSLLLGRSATLSGTAAPSAAGRTATLQRYSGGAWTTVASKVIGSTSGYAFSVKPTARGTSTYRVVVSADSLHDAGTSPARTLSVT